MRSRYDELMTHPNVLEDILQAGAQKARALSAPFMHELKLAVGLKAFAAPEAAAEKGQKKRKEGTPRIQSSTASKTAASASNLLPSMALNSLFLTPLRPAAMLARGSVVLRKREQQLLTRLL